MAKEYYKIKDDVAFKYIKGKKVEIIRREGPILHKDRSIIHVRMVNDIDTCGYTFRMEDLEPWVDITKPKPIHTPLIHVEVKLAVTLGNKSEFAIDDKNELWAIQYGSTLPIQCVPLGPCTEERISQLQKYLDHLRAHCIKEKHNDRITK